jgi:hypothetical protein
MKTEDLISALAADTLPRPKVSARMLRALPLALGVVLCAFAVAWGPRPDIAEALVSYAVLKTIVPLGLVALTLTWATASVHPATPLKRPAALIGAAGVAAAGVFAVFLARGGLAGLSQALSTPDLFVCLVSIPALSVPVLAGALWALSAGAATRPGLTGAAAGLMSAAVAASVYSLFCVKDMVLFVLPAYTSAMALVVLAGAALGPRALKW